MAFILLNRVQETATANTTVSFTLAGAAAGFEPFSAIGNGNTTYYAATDTSGHWEVGVGTYNSSGNLLVRTTPYQHTNFSLGAEPAFTGTVTVFISYLANNGVYLDPSFNVSALGTVSSGTWQGSTIGVAYGGTGVTTSSGANSVVLRDANENITINRLSQGLQTITASGGVTTLTAAADFNQLLTGTGNHTFRLPDATTLTDTTAFQFNNAATGTLTIQNNAGTTVGTVTSGGAANAVLISNATVGGTWEIHGYLPEGVTWGTNALNLGTTVISNGTWQGGTIQPAYGGTGLTTFAGANNALYSTSASALAAGTLPVAAGGTGLTSYTLNGVVYASGTGTLATGSALTFSGTGLGINTTAGAEPINAKVNGVDVKLVVQDGFTSGNLRLAAVDAGYTAYKNLEFSAAQTLFYSSGTPGMSLTSTGLGIGTSSPSVKLDVVAAASQPYASFDAPTAGYAYASLKYNGTAYGYFGQASAIIGGTLDTDFALRSQNALLFASGGGSERARIDSSGNLSMAAAGAITSSRINPRVSTSSSTATITPDIQANDQYNVTALATALTINAPTGTPVNGNKLMFRLLDNGSAQTITWNATYTVIGTTLPTATTANKMVYVGCIYNAANTRWDVIAVTTQA